MASAISGMSFFVSTPPVGLCGEFRMISLVRSVISDASSFTSTEKSRSSRNGMGTAFPSRIVDHRLVDGEAGVGIDNFISLINQCQNRKENNRLAAWNHNHFIARNWHFAGVADIVGNGLAQVGQTGGGTVVGPSHMQSVDARLDDIGRSVKVGLTDFKVNDFLALLLQSAGAVQNFKGGFSTEPRHPAGQAQFELGRSEHSGDEIIALCRGPK